MNLSTSTELEHLVVEDEAVYEEVFEANHPYFLFLLIGLFVVICPLSLGNLPIVTELKYLRVGVMGLAGLVALKWYPSRGKVGRAFLFLGFVFALSSMWSRLPVLALMYKSMFFFMILGGLCLGNALKSIEGMIALARVIMLAGLSLFVGLAAMIQQGLVEEPYWLHGRIIIAGLNSNFTGLFSALFFVFSFVVLMFDRQKIWKLLAAGVAIGTLYLVVISGSRLSLLLCLIAAGLLFLLVFERYQRLVLWSGGLFAVCLATAIAFVPEQESNGPAELSVSEKPEEGMRAFVELTKDTRSTVWRHAFKKWAESPVLGVGWNEKWGKWSLVHSAYLQICVEAGLLGLVAWLIAIWMLCKESLFVFRQRDWLSPSELRVAQMGGCSILCALLYGAGESGLIAATMPLAIALGLGIGQLDNARIIIDERMILALDSEANFEGS